MRNTFLLAALLFPLTAVAQEMLPADDAALADSGAVYDSYSDGEDYVPPVRHLIHEAYGVTYATAGVGEEEEEALKSIKSDFSLHILSTRDDGAYISGYTVRVRDKTGAAIFEGIGEGSWFLINLKPGNYVIEEALRNTAPKQQKVSVPSKGHREARFHWSIPKPVTLPDAEVIDEPEQE